jgi:hypothetical protein
MNTDAINFTAIYATEALQRTARFDPSRMRRCEFETLDQALLATPNSGETFTSVEVPGGAYVRNRSQDWEFVEIERGTPTSNCKLLRELVDYGGKPASDHKALDYAGELVSKIIASAPTGSETRRLSRYALDELLMWFTGREYSKDQWRIRVNRVYRTIDDLCRTLD